MNIPKLSTMRILSEEEMDGFKGGRCDNGCKKSCAQGCSTSCSSNCSTGCSSGEKNNNQGNGNSIEPST